jgi:integrase/recombinase XerD
VFEWCETLSLILRKFTAGSTISRVHSTSRRAAEKTYPHQQEIDAFCQYMDVERRLSPKTIESVRQSMRKFFQHTKKKELIKLRIADVERYFMFLGKKGWTRAGISGRAHHLRMFFRYGEQMRWTKPGVADAIRGPRVYQHEQLPLGPSWTDVQRLLSSTETNRKADIRDRPILLLLAVYGLRVGEVQRIRLEDINWEQKTISIIATNACAFPVWYVTFST